MGASTQIDSKLSKDRRENKKEPQEQTMPTINKNYRDKLYPKYKSEQRKRNEQHTRANFLREKIAQIENRRTLAQRNSTAFGKSEPNNSEQFRSDS
jgi:hypothetical protein